MFKWNNIIYYFFIGWYCLGIFNYLMAQTDSLNVLWNPNSEPDISGYRVYRSVNGGDFQYTDFIEHPQFKYVDRSEEIRPGNLLTYVVTAVNSSNLESIYSNPDSAGIPFINWHLDSIQAGRQTSVNLLSDFILFDPDDDVNELLIEIVDSSSDLQVFLNTATWDLDMIPLVSSGTVEFSLSVRDPAGFWDRQTIEMRIDTLLNVSHTSSDMIVFPNPFRPAKGHDKIIFEPLPRDAAELIIATPDGDIVYNEILNSSARRLEWPAVTNDNRPVASGFYIYIIKGIDRNKLDSGKIAVIR
jgi:hypothetical protein